MALSDKVETASLIVVDALNFTEYKTKNFNSMLLAFEKNVLKNDRRDILVINDSKNDKAQYSGRNLKGVRIINLENINLLDLLNYKNLLVTENAVKVLTDRYNKETK